MRLVQGFLIVILLNLGVIDVIYSQGLIMDSEDDYAQFTVWDSEFDVLNLEDDLTWGYAAEENSIDRSTCVYSLLDYCPMILNQSIYNNCVGWAVAYYGISTQLNYRLGIKNRDLKYMLGMSPNDNMYSESVNKDYISFDGSSFSFELNRILRDGAGFRLNNFSASNEVGNTGQRVMINSWDKVDLSHNPIETIKTALFSGKPLVFGVPISDDFCNGGTIDRSGVLSNLEIKPNQQLQAMTVIGFDENISGGAFEVVTSYGREFGNQGRVYIPYNLFLSFVKQIYIFDVEIPKYLLDSLSRIDLGEHQFSNENANSHLQIEWNGNDMIYVGEFVNGARNGFGALITGNEIVLYDNYPHEYQGDGDQVIEGFDDFYNFISILGEE